MGVYWSARACAVMTVVMGGFSAEGRAEPQALHIELEAPASCPDEAAFLREVRQRTQHFRIASDDEQEARTVKVTIVESGASFSGTLEVLDPGGDASVREVPGESCEEVIRALALMTALTVDPDVSTKDRDPAGEPAPTPPAQPASPAQAATPRILAPPVREVRTGWHWSTGIDGQVMSRASPKLGVGGTWFIEAEAPGTSTANPSVRAGVFFDRSSATLPSGAGGALVWSAALLEACPIRVALISTRLLAFPCAATHLGVLYSHGEHLAESKNALQWWSDVDLGVRVRFAASSHWRIAAQGLLLFPLTRPTFDVKQAGPDQAASPVFAVPAWGAIIALGAGYQFR